MEPSAALAAATAAKRPSSAPPAPGVTIPSFAWKGEIPPQKWMNFYTKVLSKLSGSGGLKLTLSVEFTPPGGVPSQRAEETRVALRELGLRDDFEGE